MRKLIIISSFLFLFCFANLQAQNSNHKNGLSYKLALLDYRAPFLGNSPLDTESSLLDKGAEIAYWRNITPFFNVGVPVKLASATLPASDEDKLLNPNSFRTSKFLGSLDLVGKVHTYEKDWLLNPYAYVGAGASYVEDDDMIVQFPLGVGLGLRLAEQVYLNAETSYRPSINDDRTMWQHGIEMLFAFGGKSKDEPPVINTPQDTDGDGVSDAEDACPNQPGKAILLGCPDKDNDGIADAEDDCPNEKGTVGLNGCPDSDGDGVANNVDNCPAEPGPAENKGCPIPMKDGDGDGVADEDDKCPTTPGLMRFAGCPDTDGDGIADGEDDCPNFGGLAKNGGCPDTDGDGVLDKMDKCITVAGPVANNGCPEIKVEDKAVLTDAMRAVQFETGSAVIKTQSLSVLDQIAEILKRYPNYNLSVDGHTDSIGDSASNMTLSERRAKACYDYIISRGLSTTRLSYNGYGETRPIADNKYKDGRETNRRVEFNLFMKK